MRNRNEKGDNMETKEEVMTRAKAVAFRAEERGAWDQNTARSFVTNVERRSEQDVAEASRFVTEWNEVASDPETDPVATMSDTADPVVPGSEARR